jgi:hypothetical protein
MLKVGDKVYLKLDKTKRVFTISGSIFCVTCGVMHHHIYDGKEIFSFYYDDSLIKILPQQLEFNFES